jgi:hypothetical protein
MPSSGARAGEVAFISAVELDDDHPKGVCFAPLPGRQGDTLRASVHKPLDHTTHLVTEAFQRLGGASATVVRPSKARDLDMFSRFNAVIATLTTTIRGT